MEIKSVGKLILTVVVIIVIASILMMIFGVGKSSAETELQEFSPACYQWTQVKCKDTGEDGKFQSVKGDDIDMFNACKSKLGALGTKYQSAQILYEDQEDWDEFWKKCRQQCLGCPRISTPAEEEE